MRLILATLMITFSIPAAAAEPEKLRWDCVFPDPTLKEVVEAPDKETADGLCRAVWMSDKNKPRRAKWKVNDDIVDDVFSKRNLER